MKFFRQPVLATSLWAILLTSGYTADVLAAPGSTVSQTGSLYADGRPASGERGNIVDFIGWRGCLYVSFRALNGDFHLDVWNISKLDSPELVEEHYHGNLNDDQNALVPVAHLKSPRDFYVSDSHLLFWASNALHVAPLQPNCKLGQTTRHTFADRFNEGLPRPKYAGQFAAARRRTGEATFGYQLFNFQDPQHPFAQRGVELEHDLSGSINGLPATVSLSNDKREATLTTFSQERKSHTTRFFGELIPHVFKVSNENTTLRELIHKTVDEAYTREELERLITLISALPVSESIAENQQPSAAAAKKPSKKKKKIKKKKKKQRKKGKKKKKRKKKQKKEPNDETKNGEGEQPDIPTIKPRMSIVKVVQRMYANDIMLRNLIEELSINPSDSLELALRRAIESNLSDTFNESVSQNIAVDLFQRWQSSLLTLPDLPLSDVRTSLAVLLNTKLSTHGLMNYLVDEFFAPLLGEPAFMRLSLSEVLDAIVNNPVGAIVDGVLNTYHTVLPGSGTLSVLGFSPPQCFQIPNSSRNFIDIALVKSGPRLKGDNRAFYEMLKAANFYFGDNDFAALERNLRSELNTLHSDLAGELLKTLIGPFSQSQPETAPVLSYLNDYGAEFDLRSTAAQLIADALITAMTPLPGNAAAAVDHRVTFETFLEAQGLYLDPNRLPRGVGLATVGDLVRLMKRLGLDDLTVGELYDLVRQRPLGVLQRDLTTPLERYASELFGPRSLDISLSQAIDGFLVGQMGPRAISAAVSHILDRILNAISGGNSLPGVLGSIKLAAQGDCISQWQLAIAVTEGLASALNLSPVALALESSRSLIQEALDKTIEYFVSSMVQRFVEEIFTNSGRSYESWYTTLHKQTTAVNIAELTGRTSRLVDFAVYEDTAVFVQRDVGFIGAVPGDNKEVTVLSVNYKNPAGSARVTSLGAWQIINTVRFSDGYLYISGNAELDGENRSSFAAKLLDFTLAGATPLLLRRESGASPFTAPNNIRAVRNGQTLAAQGDFQGIAFLEKRQP